VDSLIQSNANVRSAIVNCVCPACGGALELGVNQFRCVGRCGKDWRQSVVNSERPNLIGNPYSGVCPNGARVGTPACWFNLNAFALPPPGQFGTAGRNSLRGPGFAQCDLALSKPFHSPKETKIVFGAELFNLPNHPNFAVPGNAQNPISLGGNDDVVFKSAAGAFADNTGRIFTTIGTARQIQLDARFAFGDGISSPPPWEVICLAAYVALPRRLRQAMPIQRYNSVLGLISPGLARTKPRGCFRLDAPRL